MAYWVSSVVRGSTVGYPSDSLVFYFYFLLFLMCHYAVNWCVKLRLLFPIGGPLEPSLYLYRFLGLLGPKHCNILVEKGYYFFQRGPRRKKVTGAPDGCVTPLKPIPMIICTSDRSLGALSVQCVETRIFSNFLSLPPRHDT